MISQTVNSGSWNDKKYQNKSGEDKKLYSSNTKSLAIRKNNDMTRSHVRCR